MKITDYLDISKTDHDLRSYLLKAKKDNTEELNEVGTTGGSITAVNDFFPIFGVTLGKTTLEQAKELGGEERIDEYTGESYCTIENIHFSNISDRGILNHLYWTKNDRDFPDSWKSKGFYWENSYEAWVETFRRLGYRLIIIKKPEPQNYDGRITLCGFIYANSPDGSLSFHMDFREGEKGHFTSSPNTLYSIFAHYFKSSVDTIDEESDEEECIEKKNNAELHDSNVFYDDNGACYNRNNKVLVRYPSGGYHYSIEVPEFITEINTWGFKGDSASEIVFHENIKVIKDYIFERCNNLKKVTFESTTPGDIQIDKNAFDRFDIEKCVLEVPIEAMAEYKADERFDGFKYITAIEGSSCLKYNDDGTEVVGCKNNEDYIFIPYGVISIKDKAFEGNFNIKEVVLPDSLEYIGSCAFSGCSGISEIDLNENLEEIGYDAFKECGIKKAKVPHNVSAIGASAFSCEMIVATSNKNFKAIEGVLFNYTKEILLIYPSLKNANHYDVPSGTLEIRQFAFEDSDLRSISIPESIKKLGANIFNGCNNLRELDIHIKEPKDLEIDKESFNGFDHLLCTIVVPYGCIDNYISLHIFKGFKSIKEMDCETGQEFFELPDSVICESKPFCGYGGKFKCKVVMTSSGFFLKMLEGSYYYLTKFDNDNKSGNIWIDNQRDNKRKYEVKFSTERYYSSSIGNFTERMTSGELLYQDSKTDNTFIIDLKTGKKKEST